jgi:hypothetical protein
MLTDFPAPVAIVLPYSADVAHLILPEPINSTGYIACHKMQDAISLEGINTINSIQILIHRQF